MSSDDEGEKSDMQQIGTFLSHASKGDRVGLNLMLRKGVSPDVQDYDRRTALHLAASEGHASIVELLLLYGADVNLKDRWQRTPLTDARLYGHRDICRILEVNKGVDFVNDHPLDLVNLSDVSIAEKRGFLRAYIYCNVSDVNASVKFVSSEPFSLEVLNVKTQLCKPQAKFYSLANLNFPTVRHEKDSYEVNIDYKELNLQDSSKLKQGVFGDSEKVKWRGTWVTKIDVSRLISVKKVLSTKHDSLLRELRHPNIVQFLGSIVHEDKMILMTEYLSKGTLDEILARRGRLDTQTAVGYALDIARGMNYLHRHKNFPIVHNHLDPKNLLLDEGGNLKVGEYWVQMLHEMNQPDNGNTSGKYSQQDDIRSFGLIFHQMLEGRKYPSTLICDLLRQGTDFQPKFEISKCSGIIQNLIERCSSKDPYNKRPSFEAVISTLEEFSVSSGRTNWLPRVLGNNCSNINCK